MREKLPSGNMLFWGGVRLWLEEVEDMLAIGEEIGVESATEELLKCRVINSI